MKKNTTGFTNALGAPWGVWGGSTAPGARPSVLQRLGVVLQRHLSGGQIAVNESDEQEGEEITFGTAVNVSPIDETPDDWINISPYGEFPNEKGTQVVDRDAADSMVAAFNSLLGKVGRLFRGLPIYRGHPHQRPDLWPDDARYGRVNELQAREDGLYGKVAWNDLGQKNKEQGYYVYPSPGWKFQKLGGGRIKPRLLDHIGLTNNPNIFESVPVTNSRTTTAAPAESTTTQKENQMERTKLIAALGLAADATDEQILTAINSLATERTTLATNVQNANTEKETAINEAKRFKKLAIDHELDLAVNDGRLSAAERPQWATKFEENFEATANELKEKQPALNTKGLGLKPNGKDLSDASKRRIAFNARLDELMRPDRDGKTLSLDAAINVMRSNDEDRALLDAMQQPIAA